jgi:hypothetical protein
MARLAFEAVIACAALRRARMLLGADLGFPYVDHHEVYEGTNAGDAARSAGLGHAEVKPA